jgi:hypothetical protein
MIKTEKEAVLKQMYDNHIEIQKLRQFISKIFNTSLKTFNTIINSIQIIKSEN